MAAYLPSTVTNTALHSPLTQAGLSRIHQGKVRDTYALSDNLLLVVATDRISIFDFVLPALVPHKGEVLTALTVFWLTEVLGSKIAHHLVSYGKDMGQYLPPNIRENMELRKRAIVVQKLEMIPVECIVRGYLTGSGWSAYEESRQVCGIQLPEGLFDGSRLETSIFTPTTKAESGHDIHIPTAQVLDQYGSWLSVRSLEIYNLLNAFALSKGLTFADTKFEFGDTRVLADEVGTPDSSRLWDLNEWRQAALLQRSPSPFDKEIVRNWGKTLETPVSKAGGKLGLQNLDPENADHLHFVGTLVLPANVIDETTRRYITVLERLTSSPFEFYQLTKLSAH